MKTAHKLQLFLFLAIVILSASRSTSLVKRVNGSGMLVRMSEIEIYRDSRIRPSNYILPISINFLKFCGYRSRIFL